MALTRCRECKRPISTDANVCPSCGAKNPSGSSTLVVLLILAVVAFWYFHRDSSSKQQTAPISPQSPEVASAEQPVSVESPPPPQAEVSVAPVATPAPLVTALSPSVSQSEILRTQLRDVQNAIERAKAVLTAARNAAVQQLHDSHDYITAKTEVEEAKAAKDAAVEKLQYDSREDQDTDHDQTDVNTKVSDWLAATEKLSAMNNQDFNTNPTVIQKQEALNKLQSQLRGLQRQSSAQPSP